MAIGEMVASESPSLPFLHSLPDRSPPFPFPPYPAAKRRSYTQLGSLGSAVRSTDGVLFEAPADNDFYAF